MVVAKDVKNMDDMLLIPAGCTLTERQIDILQSWGVAEIDVADGSAAGNEDPLAKLPEATVAKLRAEIRDLFWRPDDTNPVYTEIYNLMLRRRARRMS